MNRWILQFQWYCFLRLIELDEGIEALEVAIDYKNESIESKERQLNTDDEKALTNEIRSLAKDEAINLLERYLEKVVQLRHSERKVEACVLFCFLVCVFLWY